MLRIVDHQWEGVDRACADGKKGSTAVKIDAKLDDCTITLGNNGITLRIADNDGSHVGDLRIGRATAEWRPTRFRKSNTVRLKVGKLIDLIEEHGN